MEIKFGWSGKRAVRLGCLVLLGIDSGAHPRRFSRGKGAGAYWWSPAGDDAGGCRTGAPDAGAAYVPVDWLVRPDVGGFGLADVSYRNANLRNHPGGYELQMYGEALVNCISSIL